VLPLTELKVMGAGGRLVPLHELVRPEDSPETHSVYRKNLKRVVYVTADIAGAEESPVYAIFKLNQAIAGLSLPRATGSKPFPPSRRFSPTSWP